MRVWPFAFVEGHIKVNANGSVDEASASVVTAERIVFNIKGNDYRLVAAVDFDKEIVWIKWIGTHGDYDKIDVTEVKYERT